MSPIIDLQRRLAPAGRIRIGQQVPTSNGKTRPIKLTTFRFTSSNRRAIDAVAHLYGGDAHPWEGAPTEGQWEVFTAASEIPIVVPPERLAFSQWYELWSGGGCRRRCDGQSEQLSDGPCLCDPAERECDVHTRLSVMLARLPGIGLWRLDTQGYYAATELGGSFEIAEMLVNQLGRSVLPGLLRLEERVVKRGKTLKFAVPVLDFEVDMGALALGAPPEAALQAAARADHPSGLTPIPRIPGPVPSLAEQLGAVEDAPSPPRRSNAPPAIPATGAAPRTAAEAETADDELPPRPAAPAKSTTKAARSTKAAATRKTRGSPKAGPATTGFLEAKEAAARAGQREEECPEGHSELLPNGERRVTAPMVREIMRGFGRLDVTYTREQRLLYVRNVIRDESITTTWDLSIVRASELIAHLREVNGEEPSRQ